jgi:hypothetical protein
LIRRLLPLVLALLLLAPFVHSASASTSSTPNITLNSQFLVAGTGAIVLNETLTFSNNGTSSIQVPTVQLGIPDSSASHALGFELTSTGKYTDTSSNNGTVTTFTITPSSPSLSPGTNSEVSLKSYLTGMLNITAGVAGNLTASVLLSPSLNYNVTTFDSEVVVPSEGAIKGMPDTYIVAPTPTTQLYAATKTDVRPTTDVVNVIISETSETAWQPVQVYSVDRMIIPEANGVPQIEDVVTLRNLASYSITDLPVALIASGLTNVTIVPSTVTPTINPTPVTLTDGELNIADPPFESQIVAGDNFTFAVLYNVPKADFSTSGDTVSVSLPYLLPIQAPIDTYTVSIQTSPGIHVVGAASTTAPNVTPISQGTVDVQYSVSPGWAASQAVPAATLLFAAVFIVLAFRRSQTTTEEEEEEEDEELAVRLADLIKSLEEKISLFQQFQADVANKAQGTVSRADLAKIRNELDALKARANNRLTAVRQVTTSQKYLDLLNQLQEAEREEDRATKDMINLYDQYHSKRMREETFKRLLPGYRKRVDSAMNHLSDLLNLAQREGKGS